MSWRTWRGQLAWLAVLALVLGLANWSVVFILTTLYERHIVSIVDHALPGIRAAGDLAWLAQDIDTACGLVLATDVVGEAGGDREARLRSQIRETRRMYRSVLVQTRSLHGSPAETAIAAEIDAIYFDYVEDITLALYNHAQGRPEQAAVHYAASAKRVQDELLPATRRLMHANMSDLLELYVTGRGPIELAAGTFLVVLTAWLCMATLTMLLLVLRSRRILQPLALLGLVLVAWWSVDAARLAWTVEGELKTIVDDAGRSLQTIDVLELHASQLLFNQTRRLLGQTVQEAELQAATAGMQRAMRELRRNVTFPGEAEEVALIEAAWDEWRVLETQARELAQSGRKQDALRLLLDHGQKHFGELQKSAWRVDEINRQELQLLSSNLEQRLRHTRNRAPWVWLVSVLSLVAACMLRRADF